MEPATAPGDTTGNGAPLNVAPPQNITIPNRRRSDVPLAGVDVSKQVAADEVPLAGDLGKQVITDDALSKQANQYVNEILPDALELANIREYRKVVRKSQESLSVNKESPANLSTTENEVVDGELSASYDDIKPRKELQILLAEDQKGMQHFVTDQRSYRSINLFRDGEAIDNRSAHRFDNSYLDPSALKSHRSSVTITLENGKIHKRYQMGGDDAGDLHSIVEDASICESAKYYAQQFCNNICCDVPSETDSEEITNHLVSYKKLTNETDFGQAPTWGRLYHGSKGEVDDPKSNTTMKRSNTQSDVPMKHRQKFGDDSELEAPLPEDASMWSVCIFHLCKFFKDAFCCFKQNRKKKKPTQENTVSIKKEQSENEVEFKFMPLEFSFDDEHDDLVDKTKRAIRRRSSVNDIERYKMHCKTSNNANTDGDRAKHKPRNNHINASSYSGDVHSPRKINYSEDHNFNAHRKEGRNIHNTSKEFNRGVHPRQYNNIRMKTIVRDDNVTEKNKDGGNNISKNNMERKINLSRKYSEMENNIKKRNIDRENNIRTKNIERENNTRRVNNSNAKNMDGDSYISKKKIRREHSSSFNTISYDSDRSMPECVISGVMNLNDLDVYEGSERHIDSGLSASTERHIDSGLSASTECQSALMCKVVSALAICSLIKMRSSKQKKKKKLTSPNLNETLTSWRRLIQLYHTDRR